MHVRCSKDESFLLEHVAVSMHSFTALVVQATSHFFVFVYM